MSFLLSGQTAYAGGINAEEQRLIDEASGHFIYDGKTYKAKESYLAQLKEKLSEDDMDLSAEKVDQLLATMYASVQEGLERGILEEVPETKSEPETSEKTAVQKKAEDERPVEIETDISTSGKGETETLATESSKADSVQSSPVTEVSEEREKESSTPVESEEAATEYTTVESETAKQEVLQVTTEKAVKEAVSGKIPVSIIGVFSGSIVLLLAAAGLYKGKKKRELRKLAAETGKITDIHCHILPGVDDGSEDMDMTLAMIEKAYSQGVRRIIATPHYHMGYVQSDPEKVQKLLKELKEKVCEKYPDLEIKAGNEIFFSDDVTELLQNGKILTMGGEESRYVLVEFSPGDPFERIRSAITTLVRAGYRPIIAHVERYHCMEKNAAHFEELRDQGVLFQVNYNSVGKSQWLFKHEFVDFLATDCHNTDSRAPEIQKNLRQLPECCSQKQLNRILYENPDKLWNCAKEKKGND